MFLKQKVKVQWLKEGDKCTKFFHSTVALKNKRETIRLLIDDQGNILENFDDMSSAVIKFFTNLRGTSDPLVKIPDPNLLKILQSSLPANLAANLSKDITKDEIKEGFFSQGNDRAPGPNGYSPLSFKKSWAIIEDDITTAIKQFFQYSFLLLAFNATTIALIPKIPNPRARGVRQGDPPSPFICPFNECSIKTLEPGCFKRFFWKGTDKPAAGARVSWKKICHPKSERGLGLKDLKTWNKACMMILIKNILASDGSLWVAWLGMYILMQMISGMAMGRVRAGYCPPSSSPFKKPYPSPLKNREDLNRDPHRGLDFVIAEARKYRIKLILSLTNNYESFGGKKQYVNWARSQGQYLTSDDMISSEILLLRATIRIMSRYNSFTGIHYKDDPTIMAWELMNEPRCTSDPSGRTIQAWIMEMASHVKSIDRNHLLEAGLEGFYDNQLLRRRGSIPAWILEQISLQIIGSLGFRHSYPPHMNNTSSFLNNWLDAHIRDAKVVLRKQIVLAKFGKSRKDPVSALIRGTKCSTPCTTKYTRVLQLLAEMDSLGDGYEVVLSESSSTANVIAQQSRKLDQIRKIVTRVRNVQRWKRAKPMRKGRWHRRNRGKRIGS
ncbi:hypothetical protein F3Y22_tig00110733pilonHSYRG00247 [Hibiscus syriacus]|uniref:mannan endo-1,4-beta-mannosidase n=1 Tax=Hibiscus syriacus TaxID=106335 RepID=A0A6A2ZTC3_HIBSY|nr:hypothetical protein F3Y22_tig00110733pilonHSYRG00247 [Hibiscus syriacus]